MLAIGSASRHHARLIFDFTFPNLYYLVVFVPIFKLLITIIMGFVHTIWFMYITLEVFASNKRTSEVNLNGFTGSTLAKLNFRTIHQSVDWHLCLVYFLSRAQYSDYTRQFNIMKDDDDLTYFLLCFSRYWLSPTLDRSRRARAKPRSHQRPLPTVQHQSPKRKPNVSHTSVVFITNQTKPTPPLRSTTFNACLYSSIERTQ